MFKMDKKSKHLLDLDDYCLLEIMKYIIADCELRDEPSDHPLKYEYIENFAKAHKYIEELLKTYFKNFAQQQSVIAKKKEGEAYWKLFTKAIGENIAIKGIQLNCDPSTSYPDFPKHFQMLKSALANKEKLSTVKLALNGYFLDDLPHLGHVTELYLDVSMTAEALASVCKSNPELRKLEFMTSEIQGCLSDIFPHCCNLQYLKFVPKPDVDGSEYAPLAELRKLKKMTIHGSHKNGSLLTMFKAIQKWHRSEPLSLNFSDELPCLSTVTIARINSLRKLQISSKKVPPRIGLSANYEFTEISKDTSSLEKSLATITLMAAQLEVDVQGRIVTLWECPTSEIDISQFVSLLKLCQVNSMHIENKVSDSQTPKAKLFASLIPKGLFGLKSIQIFRGQLDKLDTIELVKIKSLKLLKCSFSDWESIELLSELTNLTILGICFEKEFDNTYSKALCKLLSTCQVGGVINSKSWLIEFVKNKMISGENNGVRTLKIRFPWKRESLNELFEALSHRDLITVEEVYLERINCNYIHKITEVQSIKKLNMLVYDTNGIEQLSKLNQLEELNLKFTAKGTLFQLFDDLAAKESPSLQSLQFKTNALSPEELSKVSRIRSLKKLELVGPFFFKDRDALNKLANTNIEELVITNPNISIKTLLAAFASKTTTRLQHLKILKRTLAVEELEELSKLNGLKSFHTSLLGSNNLPFLRKLENLESLNIQVLNVDIKFNWTSLKTLVIHMPINLEKCQCLVEFENLESLTLSLLSYEWNDASDVLANMKNLKELNIETTDGSHFRVYQALAYKKGLKLKHLTAPIEFAEELNNIMRIKSLRTLHLKLKSNFALNGNINKLEKLESLCIGKAHHEFNVDDQLNTVLVILKSCRNLERFFMKYTRLKHAKFVGDVHNLLKSIRDPACQRPLSLTIEEVDQNTRYIEIVHLNFIDDDYLKVYYTNV